MDYKEPKKRTTKNDKKCKKSIYTTKHVRNLLKQIELGRDKRNNASLPTPKHTLLPNGRVKV